MTLHICPSEPVPSMETRYEVRDSLLIRIGDLRCKQSRCVIALQSVGTAAQLQRNALAG